MSEYNDLRSEIERLYVDNQWLRAEIERLRAKIENMAAHFETRAYGKDRYLFPDEIAAEIRGMAEGDRR